LIDFKNLSILYAEDDEKVKANISKILSLIFQEVHVASNGEEAFELFKNNNIHIIITDYEMPILDGYEFIKKVRDISQSIPVVILSSHTQKEKLMKCIPLKLVEYLEKPIIYEKLLETLKICLKEISTNHSSKISLTETIFYDYGLKHLFVDEKKVKLTTLEIKTLEYLLSKKNSLVSNEELAYCLYKDEEYSENAIKNIIYKLRKKLKKELIQNHKDFGYLLKSS